MLGKTSISRFLPDNEYQAAINANAPSAINPFATISDLAGMGANMAHNDLTLDDSRIHDGDDFDWEFTNLNNYTIETNDSIFFTADVGVEIIAAGADLFLQTAGAGDNIVFDTANNGAAIMPLNANPTANVTTPLFGMFTFNTTSTKPEYYNGSSWLSLESNTIYSANDTVGTTRVLTLTDTIQFEGGSTILNLNDSIDTLLIGNDVSGGAIRAGIAFNLNMYGALASRIYDRSDGTFLQGMTLKSRNDVFMFLDTSNSVASAEIKVGILDQVRTVRAAAMLPLTIQGSIAPNDANDGILFQTADASDVMITRLNIQADSSTPKAFFNAISGLYVGGTGTPTSMLTVNGDIEALGSTNGLVLEDRLGGGNKGRIYLQEDSAGVFTVYTEPVP